MMPRISEASIQAAVLQHWRTLGLPGTLVAAVPNARAFGQAGLTRGLFDLVCIGPQIGTAWIELKASDGALRPEQKRFRDLLIANGIPYAITYGREQPIRVLEDWRIVRPASTTIPKAAERSGCAGEGEGAVSSSPDPTTRSPRRTGVST
jgi:hypothetical protein